MRWSTPATAPMARVDIPALRRAVNPMSSLLSPMAVLVLEPSENKAKDVPFNIPLQRHNVKLEAPA